MNNQRIEKLKELIEEDPTDPFPLYGLAMEWAKESPEKAIPTFERLLNDFPDYLPTYYQAALLSLDCHEIAKTIAIIERGMALAKTQGEPKALIELRSLLGQLEE